MTESQFWDGSPSLCVEYHKAEKMRQRRKNSEMWMQGMYIYNAILCASPILHAFAKAGTKPRPYDSHPFPLSKREAEEYEQQEQKAQMLKILDKMKDISRKSKHLKEKSEAEKEA